MSPAAPAPASGSSDAVAGAAAAPGAGAHQPALPFAIWFYLALEGVAMSAEEVVDPRRDTPRGYIAGLHPRRRTPIWAVVVPGLLGLGVVLTGKTALAIGISTLGATILYITSMVSLLVLRRREPELARPFRAPGYPSLPIAALVLAGVCMAAIVASEPILGAVALASMSAFLLYYLAVARERVRSTRDEIPTL